MGSNFVSTVADLLTKSVLDLSRNHTFPPQVFNVKQAKILRQNLGEFRLILIFQKLKHFVCMSSNSGMFCRAKIDESNVQKEETVFASTDWKIRKGNYEKAASEFAKPDLRGKNWDLFHQLVKALITEKNVPVLEKGLEAVLAFVENCSIVDDDVVKSALNGVVKKALADVKPRIKELANRICMVLYERRKHEMVTDVLLQGMEAKNAKQALSCVCTITQALTDYGQSHVNVPAVAKQAVAMCQTNKTLFKQEIKDLLREVYKLDPKAKERYMLNGLDGPQLKAMDTELADVDNKRHGSKFQAAPERVGQPLDKPHTTHPMQQKPIKKNRLSSASPAKAQRITSPKSRKADIKDVANQGCGDRPNGRKPSFRFELDDILKMMQNKDWRERKEALDELLNILHSNSVINVFDYGKMVKGLRILILEDTNVVLVAKAIKCVTALAKSQNKEFHQHAPLMMTLLLEKFKDKKSIVVDAVREAIDALYSGYPFGSFVRYVALSLVNTNPSIKAETALFIQRCFTRPTSTLLKASHWQPLVQGLVNNLSVSDNGVRENTMKALGIIFKAVGNESLAPHVNKIAKNQLSMILRYGSQAEIIEPYSSSCAGAESISDSDPEDSIFSTESTSPASRSVLPGLGASFLTDDLDDGRSRKAKDPRNSQKYRHLSSTPYSSASSPSRSDSSSKPLSPSARQRLAKMQSEIDRLKKARKNQRSDWFNHEELGTTEEKIKNKLQGLEETISQCLLEIQEMSPKLYEELESSESTDRCDVIRILNQKLKEMEVLMKSVTFGMSSIESFG